MRVTILGCGGSSGCPSLDSRGWGACDPQNPKNRRLRPSILVEEGEGRFLVDTSPDLRQQLLNVRVNHLNGVVYTHGHADHFNGIDDLRAVNRTIKAPLDMYTNAATLEMIKQRFGYVLEPLAEGASFFYKPTLIPHLIEDKDTFHVAGIEITVFEQYHLHCKTLGLRMGKIAYSTDAVEMPDYAFDVLKGVEVWIVGALSDRPHPAHAHVEKVLAWIARVQPKRAILTHLDITLDYQKLCDMLPKNVTAAYDGMVIET